MRISHRISLLPFLSLLLILGLLTLTAGEQGPGVAIGPPSGGGFNGWGPRLELLSEPGGMEVRILVTGYSSTRDQCDDDPLITASNQPVRQGIIALSRDLLKRYDPQAPFSWGDRVHLSGVGDFTVADSMNERYTRRADIWFPDRASARQWGIKEHRLTVRPGFADCN